MSLDAAVEELESEVALLVAEGAAVVDTTDEFVVNADLSFKSVICDVVVAFDANSDLVDVDAAEAFDTN